MTLKPVLSKSQPVSTAPYPDLLAPQVGTQRDRFFQEPKSNTITGIFQQKLTLQPPKSQSVELLKDTQTRAITAVTTIEKNLHDIRIKADQLIGWLKANGLADESELLTLGLEQMEENHQFFCILAQLMAGGNKQSLDKTGNLQDTLNKIKEQHSTQATAKRLKLTLDYPWSLPLVTGPFPLMKIVMGNLLSNAIKMTAAGSIHIEVSLSKLTDDQFKLSFRIIDTGEGMTQEQLSRLFVRNQQADDSIAGKHGGTGLGLAFCKELVQMADGEINVESIKGAGSTFSFDLTFHKACEDQISETTKANDLDVQHASPNFLTNYAHEIRNPLSSFITTLELVHSTLETEHKDSQAVLELHRVCSSLKNRISLLLTYNKALAEKIGISKDSVEQASMPSTKTLESRIKAAVVDAGLYSAFCHTPLPLKTHVDPQLMGAYVPRGIADHLLQTLDLLACNAYQHGTTDSPMEVGLHFKPSSDDEPNALQLHVNNSVDEKQTPHLINLFSLFNQYALHPTAEIPPLNPQSLGLATVALLTKVMGGQITFIQNLPTLCGIQIEIPGILHFSRPASWTPAKDDLSLIPPSSHSQAITSCSPSKSPDISVLIVEDNVVNQKVLKKLFANLGCKNVTIADSCASTMESLKNMGHCDLVLMDEEIITPKQVHESGKKILDKIKPDYPHLPVIRHSGNHSLSAESEAIAQGFNGFAAKPISKVKLQEILKEHTSYTPPKLSLTQSDSSITTKRQLSPRSADQPLPPPKFSSPDKPTA